MYRTFPAAKDAYITDRVIRGHRVLDANTGRAGTLDLFKLYGVTASGTVPNTEISRLLVWFDLTDLRSQLSASARDASDPTFHAHLSLKDVYSGHTTPSNFHIVVYPLSQSFDEGTGRDVSMYRDVDVCNFLTASWNGGPVTWHASGANALGLLGSPDIDVIASGNLGSGISQFGVTQYFTAGDEDLYVDITTLVSATLAGLLPDYGFRLSFTSVEETDARTRFVKRFGARGASDSAKHPKLIVRWNDSVQNDRNNLTLDTSGTIYLFNHYVGGLRNIVSGTALSPVTGTGCISLRLETPISGGTYSASFVGSQLTVGNRLVDGTYYATVAIPSSDPQLVPQLAKSGSISFKEIWGSLDGTVGFYTGSLVMFPQDMQTFGILPVQFTVNIVNCGDVYRTDESPVMRAFVQKIGAAIPVKKIPAELPSYIPSEVHYSVRDSVSDEVIIPFDETFGSTKMSSDSGGLTFRLFMDTFVVGRTYSIDVLVKEGTSRQIYRDASQKFRIEEST